MAKLPSFPWIMAKLADKYSMEALLRTWQDHDHIIPRLSWAEHLDKVTMIMHDYVSVHKQLWLTTQVLAISETWLRTDEEPIGSLINNYQKRLLHSRQTWGGGVMLQFLEDLNSIKELHRYFSVSLTPTAQLLQHDLHHKFSLKSCDSHLGGLKRKLILTVENRTCWEVAFNKEGKRNFASSDLSADITDPKDIRNHDQAWLTLF